MKAKRATTINIFDFDHTIYDGDCMFDFYFFNLKRQPSLLSYLPYQCWYGLLFMLRLKNRTSFKGAFFSYLRGVKDVDSRVNQFWDKNFVRIKSWYRVQDHSNDVIITASPRFLVEPVFRRLAAKDLIATHMDKRSGAIEGDNCRGKEKVRRLEAKIPDAKIQSVYSDSLVDMPLFQLASKRIVVRGDKLLPLEEYIGTSTFRRMFLKHKF